MRLLLALLLLPATLAAQGTAVLTGSVRAQSGAPVAAGRVTFEPSAAAVETDGQGRFRLAVPAGVPGTVSFAAVGFSPEELPVPALPASGSREIAVTLAPLYTLDALTVVAQQDRPLLNTEDAATGGAVERAELEALPTDQRDPLSLLFNIPGVAQSTGFFGDAPSLAINGSNSLYTQYTLDGLDNNEGFLGGPRVDFPLGGLAREEALVNTYSTEYGRSSNGVINLVSRAGSNETRGDVFGYWRPGRPFDARNKIPEGGDPELIERQQDGFRRFQIGGGISGPLARDRTFGAFAAEYTNENEDRIGSTALTAFVGTELREKVKLFGRVDHGWSPSQTTTLRAAFSHANRAGNGSGVVTPEADITTRRIGSLTALTHRSAFSGGRASNIASVQLGTFRWYFPPTESDFTRPQVTVVSPDGVTTEAVVGSSNFIFDEKEIQLQFRDVFETRLGDRHTLRVGADLITAWFELAGAQTNPNGAYVVYNDGNITGSGDFLSIDDIPSDVRVRSYTIDANPQQVDLTQTLVGAFIEDRWRISPSLVVQVGLRWDYDDITSRGESDPDLNNVQPRVSFNWLRSARSVVRGGVGLYTGKFPYAIYSDAVQFGPNGNATVTFAEGTAFPPPAYGQGPTAADLATLRGQLPPREQRRAFALGLEQPRSWQATLGWQQQFGDAWAISIDAVYADTRHLPRSLDLNAISQPLTAADSLDRTTSDGDPNRPVAPVAGSYRRLTTTEAGGRARYYGLYTSVRRRLSDAWTVDANWAWSKAQNDTEDINFNAYQANCFSKDMVDAVTGAACTSHEWADAINDRRHKVTLRTVYTWASRVRLSVIGDFQTGQPVNRVAFFRDLDGSGGIFGNGFIGNDDRFLGVDRNVERLPSFFNLSAGVAYLLDTRVGALRAPGRCLQRAERQGVGELRERYPGRRQPDADR